jgi:hypothetical protein
MAAIQQIGRILKRNLIRGRKDATADSRLKFLNQPALPAFPGPRSPLMAKTLTPLVSTLRAEP